MIPLPPIRKTSTRSRSPPPNKPYPCPTSRPTYTALFHTIASPKNLRSVIHKAPTPNTAQKHDLHQENQPNPPHALTPPLPFQTHYLTCAPSLYSVKILTGRQAPVHGALLPQTPNYCTVKEKMCKIVEKLGEGFCLHRFGWTFGRRSPVLASACEADLGKEGFHGIKLRGDLSSRRERRAAAEGRPMGGRDG